MLIVSGPFNVPHLYDAADIGRCMATGGIMHKEIFSLPRATSGPYKGKEFELVVKPVIDRWSRFVREYGPPVNATD